MIITMNRDALAHAAQVAGRVASRGTTPAMACVLIEAEGDACSFSATDGDRHVRHTDMAMVEEPGRCMVSAMALGKAVKSLRDGAVTVEASSGSVSVSCGRSRFGLPALDPGEWMGAPLEADGPSCRIEAAVLHAMCRRVAPFAAGDKEAREMLRGVHLVSDGTELRMEASDSYRICVAAQPAEGDPFECLVPTGFLTLACESMFGEVSVKSDGRRVRLSCGATEMGARCVSARFPDIGRMFQGHGGFAVARDALLGAVSRASQLGDGKFGLSLDASGGEMRVHAEVGGVGSFEDYVPCGGECSVFVDSRFLKSCIDAMDCEEVEMAVSGPTSPIGFYGGSVKTLVLPLRRMG